MEKEKVIYFKETLEARTGLRNDIMYDIIIEIADGPFSATYCVGNVNVTFDEENKNTTIRGININEKYKCLDLIPKVLDIASDISRVFGFREIFVESDPLGEDGMRTLKNKGFVQYIGLEDLRRKGSNGETPFYCKDTRGLL